MPANARLTVVTPFLDKRHGTERCVAEQVERLARNFGWEGHIYSQRVEDLDWSGTTPGGILFHRVPPLPGPHLLQFLWWLFANRVRRGRRKAGELVYSPGINCFDADVISVHILFAAFREQIRDELELGRHRWRDWPRVLHRRLYYWLVQVLEKRVYARDDLRLVAVSRRVASDLARHCARRDPVPVVYHGVDSARFHPRRCAELRPRALKTLALTPDGFHLLLIGNDWKQKGLEILLGALCRVARPSLRLLVVGEDRPELFVAAVRRRRLEGRVRFLPPRSDVELYYAAADAYVAPSLEDAFALPVLEAMACGLPVIVSRRAGASEIVSDGVDGLILKDPRDPAELAEHIGRINADEDLRRRLGERAAETARRYTWERNAEEMHSIFTETLQERRRAQTALRVLVLAPSLDEIGGIQRYTAVLVRSLQRLGGATSVRLLELPGRAGKNSVGRLGAATKSGFAARVIVESIVWSPDLVISAHVGLATAGRLAQRLGSRHWVLAHGIEVWGELPKRKRDALRRADRIVCVSDFTRRQVMERHEIPAERMAWLPPQVETSRWAPAEASRTQRVALTVGRLAADEAYKGHDTVLRALAQVRARVPGLVYDIVGDGDDRPRLEELACRLGVQGAVRFRGALTDEALAQAYRDCDVFVMPSRTVLNDGAPKGEGFGLTLLEAMACGKPVIGPNLGAPTEFIEHGRHGLLVNPDDPQAVATALTELLTQPERAQRLGVAARARAQAEFSSERFAERLETLLRESRTA
jgi:glycosyltransferase involved in cell wall biosynthesis